MTELDALERDLLEAADIWLNQSLHRKLQRVIALARLAEDHVARIETEASRKNFRRVLDYDYPKNEPD
jgi:hypothetical protein